MHILDLESAPYPTRHSADKDIHGIALWWRERENGESVTGYFGDVEPAEGGRAWLVGYGRASDGRDRSCLIHSDAAARRRRTQWSLVRSNTPLNEDKT